MLYRLSWVHVGGQEVRDKGGWRHDGWQGRASRQERSQLSGRIYRLNRTVSTRLCHLLECARRCMCAFALTRALVVIFPLSSEMSGRHGYVRMFCLQALIIQPYVEWFAFVSAPSYDIWHILQSLLALFVAACYSSRTQVCLRKHGTVQGFLIDFCCSAADNIFIIILYNIIYPG